MGIETGPGCLFTGAIGGVILGIAGYWGANWVIDYVEEYLNKN